MPHLVIERLRTCPSLFTISWPAVKSSRFATYTIEVLDIVAAIIFVFGSICFLPTYATSMRTLFLGCSLFIYGSALYCGICMFTFSEALTMKGGCLALEVWENGLYLLGSVLFLVGSILYLPGEAHDAKSAREALAMSLGQICETISNLESQRLGAILFIVGSVLFVLAAFTNLLNQQKADAWSSRMLSAVTTCYMGGSMLFALGSVAFLPHLGCGEPIVALGAWCFIVGSALFLVGGLVSLRRTIWVLDGRGAEGILLVR